MDRAGQTPWYMRETTVAFKDGNDMELSDKDNRLLSRRVALAGAAGALALAGTGLMGCSVGGTGSNDASTATNELTDEQKKLHKQIVATYDVRSRRPSRSGSMPSTPPAATARPPRLSRRTPLAPIP